MKEPTNNCLVALLNNKADFGIAQTQRWYRIPVESAPWLVKNDRVKYLAFYHTKAFDKERNTVQWYGEVTGITIVKRKDLFPAAAPDAKSENDYYKISFGALRRLPNAIICRRPRRLLFIPTTEEKLFNSTDINELFSRGPLEEKLWRALTQRGIAAERQYVVDYRGLQNFYLDFAVFCRDVKLDIECDDKELDMPADDLEPNNKRTDCLESIGWSVLRFTGYDLTHDFERCVSRIREAIIIYGGVN